MRLLWLAIVLMACADTEEKTRAEAPAEGGPDATRAPSSGDCPDLTQSHTTSFTSSDEDRTVTVVLPDEPPANMPVIFFFHGLLDPGTMPDPTAYMASALNLQQAANQYGVAFILPESQVLSRMGISFFMWAADEYEGPDITLYDDLRSCADDQLDIDLYSVHGMGFSGGALFTTVVARDRGNTLASIIEMSGGSDIDMLTFDEPLSAYDTPDYKMPALLISGGPDDAWPGNGLELVNFSNATDSLEEQLVEDGHFVVRCEHTYGHQVPMNALDVGWAWINAHRYDEPSPIQADGLTGEAWADWCEVAS